MTEHPHAAAPRRRLPRSAGRALVLAGVGTGLWLLGSAASTASADEAAPPPGPVLSVASDLLAPVGQVVAPVTQQVVVPAASPVVRPVVTDVLTPTVQQVVVPVVDQVVVPVVDRVVVPVVDRVVVPVVDQVVVPVVDQVVEPVVEHVVEPVVEPVVGDVVVPVVSPVTASAGDPRTPLHTPAADGAAQPELAGDAPSSVAMPTATVADLSDDSAPSPARASSAAPAAADEVLAGPAAPGTTPGPSVPAAPGGLPASSTPASSAGSGSSAGDQTPAYLSSAPRTVLGAALAAALGTGSRPARPASFEPSFSPD